LAASLAEIDKRVDARLSASSSVSRSPAQIRQSSRIQAAWAGAGITGLAALITDSGSQSKAVTAAVIAVWAILAIACLGTAAVRWHRGRERG
jgi:hypothetical protein